MTGLVHFEYSHNTHASTEYFGNEYELEYFCFHKSEFEYEYEY